MPGGREAAWSRDTVRANNKNVFGRRKEAVSWMTAGHVCTSSALTVCAEVTFSECACCCLCCHTVVNLKCSLWPVWTIKACCRRARLCTPSRQQAQRGRPRPEEISQVFPVQELRRVINSPDEGTFSQPVTQQWLLRVHNITAKTLMCLMRSSLNEFLMIMSIQTFILESYQTVALCFLQLHWLILNQSVILNVGQTKKKPSAAWTFDQCPAPL